MPHLWGDLFLVEFVGLNARKPSQPGAFATFVSTKVAKADQRLEP